MTRRLGAALVGAGVLGIGGVAQAVDDAWITTGGVTRLLDSPIGIGRSTDTFSSLQIVPTGAVFFGDGSRAPDTTLYRAAPFTLRTDGDLIAMGAVGIGTPLPEHALHVVGDLLVQGAEGDGLLISNDSGQSEIIALNDGDLHVRAYRTLFDAPVGIGTDSPAASRMLHVIGPAARFARENESFSFELQRLDATPTAGDPIASLEFVGSDSSGDTHGYFYLSVHADQIHNGAEKGSMRFTSRTQDTLTERMRITGDGNVGIGTSAPDQRLSVNGDASKSGGGSWLVFSDARLKKVLGRFEPGLDEVLKLEPVRYRYKPDNALGLTHERAQVGFVAQDVAKVLPEAVRESARGYLVVDSDPILWATLNAVKQEHARSEALARRVDKLEGELARLEAAVAKLSRLAGMAGHE